MQQITNGRATRHRSRRMERKRYVDSRLESLNEAGLAGAAAGKAWRGLIIAAERASKAIIAMAEADEKLLARTGGMSIDKAINRCRKNKVESEVDR